MQLLKNHEDEIAFEYLYKNYVNLMLYTANSILNNYANSEDAVQLAFVRIAKHFDSVEKSICPKTANQFVIIVRNIAIDIYRKRHREATLEFIEELCGYETQAAYETDFDTAMAQLPQQQRDILYLYHIYGLNVKEISKLLGISKAAAYKRIERAAKQLKEIYEEDY
ncbi:MAG: sigma-70 family RNA polymerase sigma factor [Clostridiaceae bacterium]|nr:sigma-70 family RNA polymerase sigma factor [Clostridiaceae bacterium]